MSFYLLPQVSYQTQQKFQKQVEHKQRELNKMNQSSISRKNSLFSNDSYSSNDSIFSAQQKTDSESNETNDLNGIDESDEANDISTELNKYQLEKTTTVNTTTSKKSLSRKISSKLNLSVINSNQSTISSKPKSKAYDYGCHDSINDLVKMNKKLEKEKRKLNSYDYSIYDLYEDRSHSSLRLTKTISSASSIFSTKPTKTSFFRKNKNLSQSSLSESSNSILTSNSSITTAKYEKYEPIVCTESIIDQISKFNSEINSPLIQLQDEINFKIVFKNENSYNELLINLTQLTNKLFEKQFSNISLDLYKNDSIRNNYLKVNLSNFDNIHSKLESFDKILNFNGLDFLIEISCRK